jgi:hypothetical protein
VEIKLQKRDKAEVIYSDGCRRDWKWRKQFIETSRWKSIAEAGTRETSPEQEIPQTAA